VGQRPHQEAALVFNGDFHWLDVDPEDFEEIGAAGLPAFAGTTYGVMTRRCGRRRWRGPRPRV
jgi:hypothetical protein